MGGSYPRRPPGNDAGVWQGAPRVRRRMPRYAFDFDPSYRWAALPFGVTPGTAHVDLSDEDVRVRFGPWRLRTSYANVVEVTATGGFTWLKTAGPPHLSFADRGVTFATNGRAAVCLR